MLLSKLKTQFSLSSFDIAKIALASSLLVIVQLAFAFLPNVELVTIFLILYTIHFRFKTLYIIYIFAIVEALIFGFSIWWFSYLYVWLMLFIFVYSFRNIDSPLIFALISSIFGLSFGALTSLPFLFTGGICAMISYIASGVVFDIVHCIANFLVVFILFKPLNHICSRLNTATNCK